MPAKTRRKRGGVKNSQPRARNLRAQSTTANEIALPSQSSSVEANVNPRRSKRQRKKTDLFQVNFMRSTPKTKSNKQAVVNASSSEASDEFRLKCIFPEEIWMIILEKCEQSTDLENLSNASLYFRDLLLPQRVNFLFPNVWKILGNKYHENYGSFKGHDESFNPNQNRVQLISNRNNIFRQYSILKLRLVCKDWNKSIEDFYQYHPSHFDTYEQSKCIVSRTTNWPNLSGYSVGEFLLHFRNTHGQTNDLKNRGITKNPFLSRKVFLNVCLDDRENAPTRWQEMSMFLCSYGHHIWYIDLKIYSVGFTAWMSVMEHLLPRMPNLKGLRVGKTTALCMEEPLSPETLKTFSFPKLKYLQFLSVCTLPHFLQDMLERSYSHVSKLEFQTYNHYYFTGIFHEFSCPHAKLKSLAVTVNRTDDYKRLQLLSMKWKLTELTLNFTDDLYEIRWSDIFHLIENKWGKTLTVLSLKLPFTKNTNTQTKIMKKCASFRLRLPRLKCLTIVLPEFCSLDFIIPMKKTLEELNVHIQFRYRFSDLASEIERLQHIQFLGYTRRPLESNIWNIFRKLRRYRSYEQVAKDIPVWSYSRYDWEVWKCRQSRLEADKIVNQKSKRKT